MRPLFGTFAMSWESYTKWSVYFQCPSCTVVGIIFVFPALCLFTFVQSRTTSRGLVGHSSGGASAALLSIMLRKKSKEELGFSPDIISAVGFGTPPGVSREIAEVVRPMSLLLYCRMI